MQFSANLFTLNEIENLFEKNIIFMDLIGIAHLYTNLLKTLPPVQMVSKGEGGQVAGDLKSELLLYMKKLKWSRSVSWMFKSVWKHSTLCIAFVFFVKCSCMHVCTNISQNYEYDMKFFIFLKFNDFFSGCLIWLLAAVSLRQSQNELNENKTVISVLLDRRCCSEYFLLFL